jgi:microcystin-dependent protein
VATPFIGQITLFAGNFAPRGWAFCDGQILAISQNTALFSILGTTYGGNGQTTYALPDLRGRVAVGPRQGPGLANVSLGEVAGVPTVTLLATQMPAHNHLINANGEDATSSKPTGRVLAAGGAYADAGDGTTMNASTASNAGGSQPHENHQPYLGMNYLIAIEGIFPSRN